MPSAYDDFYSAHSSRLFECGFRKIFFIFFLSLLLYGKHNVVLLKIINDEYAKKFIIHYSISFVYLANLIYFTRYTNIYFFLDILIMRKSCKTFYFQRILKLRYVYIPITQKSNIIQLYFMFKKCKKKNKLFNEN